MRERLSQISFMQEIHLEAKNREKSGEKVVDERESGGGCP